IFPLSCFFTIEVFANAGQGAILKVLFEKTVFQLSLRVVFVFIPFHSVILFFTLLTAAMCFTLLASRSSRSHHFSTRSARRVFQRLDAPRRSSSKYVFPWYACCSNQRPSSAVQFVEPQAFEHA